MKKKDFITLILSVIGGLFLSIGMCMSLLPEWDMVNQGKMVGIIGIIILFIMILIRRKMEGKVPIKFNLKTIGIVLFGIISTLILGIGICMIMLNSTYMVQGIVVGIVGIILLICMIPMCKGIN